ncbi:stress-induced protein [Salinarimonas soli]|uniref:Stress-induced protein n=1 Tax=Salinarimonas soli TaxID=1638099 RepID=A0A5B2VFP1_9HYPH|nr:stress-induced protein [Salinarimonas soli]
MSPERHYAIASRGGAAVPAEKRAFARDRTLAVESARKARSLGAKGPDRDKVG